MAFSFTRSEDLPQVIEDHLSEIAKVSDRRSMARGVVTDKVHAEKVKLINTELRQIIRFANSMPNLDQRLSGTINCLVDDLGCARKYVVIADWQRSSRELERAIGRMGTLIGANAKLPAKRLELIKYRDRAKLLLVLIASQVAADRVREVGQKAL